MRASKIPGWLAAPVMTTGAGVSETLKMKGEHLKEYLMTCAVLNSSSSHSMNEF
jgi:hypothetical protein